MRNTNAVKPLTIDTPPREEGTIPSADGTRLYFHHWRATSRPNAVVAICHGVNSHGGQYDWAARQLSAAGYPVFAIDLRGRGRSDGPRYFVEHVARYVEDVSALIGLAKSRHPGVPVFLLGHSAGGVISCTYALDHGAEIAGLICESFAYQIPAPKPVLGLVKLLSRFAPHLPVLRLANEDFSRDPVAVATLNRDPLTLNERQPAATVAALVRADERLTRDFPRMRVPVLILHGTADRATVAAGSKHFFATTGSTDKSIQLYDGHFHDLLNDFGKEKVIADIVRWLDARAGRTN
jgi:acylglycerol lipase